MCCWVGRIHTINVLACAHAHCQGTLHAAAVCHHRVAENLVEKGQIFRCSYGAPTPLAPSHAAVSICGIAWPAQTEGEGRSRRLPGAMVWGSAFVAFVSHSTVSTVSLEFVILPAVKE